MQPEYYIDCEFIEGEKRAISWLPQLFWHNHKRWFMQLISIGIYCSDGRSYYAISSSFDEKLASPWVIKNVISKLPPKYKYDEHIHPVEVDMAVAPFYRVPNELYKSNKQIAEEVFRFVNPHIISVRYNTDGKMSGSEFYGNMLMDKSFCKKHAITSLTGPKNESLHAHPKFYGSYSDYDWIALCGCLFGSMMALPEGFPMYCHDLKQDLDRLTDKMLVEKGEVGAHYIDRFNTTLSMIKSMKGYPKIDSANEHMANADAEWTFKLHNFIKTLEQ